MHRQHVGISLDQVAAPLFLDGPLGLVDAVELVALVVNIRFGRVEVFAYLHPRLQDASAKGDHLARYAVDREHDPAREEVVDAAVLPFAAEPRFEQIVDFIAPFLGLHGQGVALFGRISQPELADDVFVEAPLLEVGQTYRTAFVGLEQRLAEELLGEGIDDKHVFALASLLTLFVGQLLFMNLDVVFLGQVFQRFVVGELLVLHDEVYGAAPLAATETFANPFRRRYAERGRPVVVKRAQPPIVGSTPAQADEVGYDIDDVGRGHNFIDGCLVYHLFSFGCTKIAISWR